MELVFLEKHIVKPSAYGPPERGYFAVDDPQIPTTTWDKCREQFAARFTKASKSLFFCHDMGDGRRPAWFLIKTEQIIGITELKHSFCHSRFSETDRVNVIWIEPSTFWLESEMHRQLLTIILRAGMNYSPEEDNYEEALWMPDKLGSDYAAQTKSAISRFLYGFTEYVGHYSNSFNVGWVEIFKEKSDEVICDKLIRPSCEPKQSCVIGIGKLWG